MRRRAVLVIILIGLLTLCVIGVENASAGGDAALMDKVIVTATPSQQAVGGELEIIATFYIYGGCCYHLYTHDVVPVWEFPEEIEILDGPNPEKYDVIDGLPGGEAVLTSITWKVCCWKKGNYNLKVTIESSNSGSVEGQCSIGITEGPVITTPKLFPAKPETGKELSLTFDVYSAIKDFEVTDVAMYYTVMDESGMNITAEGQQYTVNEGGLLKKAEGEELELATSEASPITYTATIPAQDNANYIYYWIFAKDTALLEVTSPVAEIEITDFEKANSVVRYVFFSFLLVSVIGVILIILIHALAGKRQVRDKTRLFRLGSMGNTEFMDEEDRPKEPKPILLYIVIGVVVIIGIILVILSFYTGSFDEIITHLREGK